MPVGTTTPSSGEGSRLLAAGASSSSSSGTSRSSSQGPHSSHDAPNERTSLLSDANPPDRSYTTPVTLTRSISSSSQLSFRKTPWRPNGPRTPGLRTPRHHDRGPSWGAKVAAALQSSWHGGQSSHEETGNSKYSLLWDERVWYDQYTSTDWVHDSIADNFRVRDLRSLKGIRGQLWQQFDASQGWILAAIIGVLTAFVAYFVDFSENAIFDIKEGFCTDGWHKSKGRCCLHEEDCPLWSTWGDVLRLSGIERRTVDLVFYVGFVVLFAVASAELTLTTRTVVPSNVSLPTVDENLAAERFASPRPDGSKPAAFGSHASPGHTYGKAPPPMTYYPAAGSGVAEVKVILSGFVLHGYLGLETLIVKTLGLILSVASGLCLGKEGPFVHIATCIGNIVSRIFAKYRNNDAKRREVLSASAASGVAVAFGAPIAGTLFSLEEVSYYFPPKTLFRTFFCCTAAALSLKFLDPYGTGKIVIFEVRYVSMWNVFEIVGFIVLGVLGGTLGALFIKASRLWAKSFRRIGFIKRMPMLEVVIVALVTGLLQFWNKHTKQAVAQLLSDLASPCSQSTKKPSTLCPSTPDEFRETAVVLAWAFLIKSFLTTVTFGLKVPAGIYVPSMVVGGIMGRLFGHGLQYITLQNPTNPLFAQCSVQGGPEACITPGVYAMVAAGATMCGVTRLSVTLVVILFELTGSFDHVLPFSLAVLVARWTADALEPLSIYDLLTEINQYPYLDNKTHPVFTSSLSDITPRVRGRRMIDISRSVKVPVTKLRTKLAFLQSVGEIDGGLPLVRHGVLVGLLPAPDLEFALDKLREQYGDLPQPTEAPPGSDARLIMGSATKEILCLMSHEDEDEVAQWSGQDTESDEGDEGADPTRIFDLTPYVDPAPVALDVHSPMDLVYQCFVKLGLRFVCVTRDGQYAGMVHKKAFVKYIRDLSAGKEI